MWNTLLIVLEPLGLSRHCRQKCDIRTISDERLHSSSLLALNDGWGITNAVFEKQMSAILEFYFRFRSRPFHHDRSVILHTLPNCVQKSAHWGNMTSYPFLKMAATAAKYYFRFRICWCHCLQKGIVYQQTKFHRHNLNSRLRYNYSGFDKQTSAILEFHFPLPVRSRPFRRNRHHVILHPAAKFRQNWNIHCGNMASYRFSRWRPSAMLYLLWG